MPEATLLELTEEQQIRFGNDTANMTDVEAMGYVVDDLAMEMAQIQKTYLDQTPYLKPSANSEYISCHFGSIALDMSLSKTPWVHVARLMFNCF